jgi:hypothetical protein
VCAFIGCPTAISRHAVMRIIRNHIASHSQIVAAIAIDSHKECFWEKRHLFARELVARSQWFAPKCDEIIQ